ncbi:MAG: TraB/GumN family protein [Muribaculaceae bacterium]|nr:TraB/GumN family protein [Muribaculaceae bacterium]
MRKRLLLTLAVSLLAITASSQLLWKVTGNNLARPSYIMGTYHMAPASMMDKIGGMEQALQGCDVVVGEIEKESLLSQEAQLAMAQAMIAPPDSTLDKLFSPDDYAIIEGVFNKYFGTMGVKLSQMNMLKPGAISMQMQAMQALKNFPTFNQSEFIDMAVQTRANELGRPSIGLETVEEQIDLLFNGPLTEQAEGLLDACKKDDLFMVQSSALVEAYMSQDLSKIEKVISDPELGGDDAEAMDALIYDRNRAWAAKLVQMMPERACLVCVGAGHLPGTQGLLQLLRDRGYTVEPMQ